MKIYDISQEVFGCQVYPGDPAPERAVLQSMTEGAVYNLTAFHMCAHNGTHIDAPFHFIQDGKTVDEIPLEAVVGMTYVAEHRGIVTGNDAREIVAKAKNQNPEAAKRILLKGDVEVSLEAAKVFASSDILLLGNESQTVGPQDEPMAVHLVLLGADVILLEGIRLAEVSEGVYLLNAAPLNLSGADGSPCRAVLIDPMMHVNIVYDDVFDDADIIAIPYELLPNIERIGQEFLDWVPTAEDREYWTVVNGRRCTVVETDGFIKWLNNTYCIGLEKCYVVARNTTYDPTRKVIEF